MSGEEIYQDPKTHQKDDELYRQLREETEKRELLQEFFIPKESGRAFVVEKGQILRIADFEGPQVADFNAFSKENPVRCSGLDGRGSFLGLISRLEDSFGALLRICGQCSLLSRIRWIITLYRMVLRHTICFSPGAMSGTSRC